MRASLAILGVLAATVVGGGVALSAFGVERELSVGRIGLSVAPFHRGALDLYVPLVDWGVRFPGVRLPARLQVDLRAVDRDTARAVAEGEPLRVQAVRGEGRDAIASYLRLLLGVVVACALALGLLTALALRSGHVAPFGRLWPVAAGGAVLWGLGIAFLLPPRGSFDDPEYYAQGPDIPVALRALEDAGRSAGTLSEELDGQLVGLARLVQAPARRTPLRGLPRLVVASDLHNNVLALPALRQAARGGPVLFPGDLTDRGSPLETAAVRQVVRAGRPFVFTSGNHDSDVLSQQLARRGAIVLTSGGRLLPDGRRGDVVVRVAGLRVAGYDSPNERKRSEGYRDRGAEVTEADQEQFARWLLPLAGRVDVVLVHEPALAAPALERLRADPGRRPLLVLTGHTHRAAVEAADRVVEVNPGTLGAGGTGNLAEGQDLSLAVVTVRRAPFEPLAVDTVTIDLGSGSASAERLRLDQPSESESESDPGSASASSSARPR